MKKFLLALAGFCGALFLFAATGCEDSNGTRVTLSEYNEIEFGMTYDQVVAIIGDDPTQSASASGGPYGRTAWAYEWDNRDGSFAIVTFANTNGTVVAKVQSGLD